MALRDGAPGTYDQVVPVYTVFHERTETFSTIWTEYDEDPDRFAARYRADAQAYGGNLGFAAKPDCPENAVNVSMLPWSDFTSFQLNLAPGEYLLPIFTFGRAQREGGRIRMPASRPRRITRPWTDSTSAACWTSWRPCWVRSDALRSPAA